MIYGARRRRNSAYEEYLTTVVLPHMPILDVDVATATLYGELRAQSEQHGRLHSDIDLLVAATAIRHDLTLVTRNVRDFEGFENLEVADWML
jgi:predicted nucleic acid-binding protein